MSAPAPAAGHKTSNPRECRKDDVGGQRSKRGKSSKQEQTFPSAGFRQMGLKINRSGIEAAVAPHPPHLENPPSSDRSILNVMGR